MSARGFYPWCMATKSLPKVGEFSFGFEMGKLWYHLWNTPEIGYKFEYLVPQQITHDVARMFDNNGWRATVVPEREVLELVGAFASEWVAGKDLIKFERVKSVEDATRDFMESSRREADGSAADAA